MTTAARSVALPADLNLVPRSRARHAAEARHHTEDLLAQLSTTSSPAARRDLEQAVVLLNLGLADAIAARYTGRGIERDDLVQVGRLGLVKAVRRYDCRHGISFAGFAVPTIAGEIKRHFRDFGWTIRPPRRLQELHLRLRDVELELEQELHRPPTVSEVAHRLEVDPAEVRQAKEAASSFHALSLDQPGSHPASSSFEEVLASDVDSFAGVEEADWLEWAVAQLTERERLVLQLRFEQGLTQSEIARQLQVSQMQVSRILRNVLRRLRSLLLAAEATTAA